MGPTSHSPAVPAGNAIKADRNSTRRWLDLVQTGGLLGRPRKVRVLDFPLLPPVLARQMCMSDFMNHDWCMLSTHWTAWLCEAKANAV